MAALAINTNLTALTPQNQLNSLQRLSSGLRINQGVDDAAGLSILEPVVVDNTADSEPKRLRYFQGEFLSALDFTDEQQYHLDALRCHNRNLHTWGIANGLDVHTVETNPQAVVVTSGMALDRMGRQILLTADKTLSTTELTGAVYLTVTYHEEATDPVAGANVTGTPECVRITEEPVFTFKSSPPADPSLELILAQMTLDEEHNVTAITLSGRHYAGSATHNIAVNRINFSLPPQSVQLLLLRQQALATLAQANQSSQSVLQLLGGANTAATNLESAPISLLRNSDPAAESLSQASQELLTQNTAVSAESSQLSAIGDTDMVSETAGLTREGLLSALSTQTLEQTDGDDGIAAQLSSGLRINNNLTAMNALSTSLTLDSAWINFDQSPVVEKTLLSIGAHGDITLTPSLAGNVGIGTNSPQRAKLETVGAVGNTLALFGQDTQGISLVAVKPGVGFNAYFNEGWKSITSGYTGFIQLNPENGNFEFYTGGCATAADQAMTPTLQLKITTDGRIIPSNGVIGIMGSVQLER